MIHDISQLKKEQNKFCSFNMRWCVDAKKVPFSLPTISAMLFHINNFSPKELFHRQHERLPHQAFLVYPSSYLHLHESLRNVPSNH